MAKILRKSKGSISKLSVFVGQKLILHTNIQNVKDEIQIQVCKEIVTHVCQFISVKVQKF